MAVTPEFPRPMPSDARAELHATAFPWAGAAVADDARELPRAVFLRRFLVPLECLRLVASARLYGKANRPMGSVDATRTEMDAAPPQYSGVSPEWTE